MLTLSPRIFSTLAWEADDSMSTRDHEFTCEDPFANFIAHDQPELNYFDDHLQQSITTTASSSSHKKLNHNAYERDRRKKLNTLYTSLHALLPEIDRSQKKLSIPSTISRVLKYIPELQREVVRLKRRKEEIAMMATRREEVQVIRDGIEDSPVVSATLLSNKEVMVHICIMNKNVTSVPLSKILRVLEGEGLELIHASTSTTFGYRRFYSLHLKIKQCTNMACEHLVKVIREKARCDSFIQ